MKIIFAQGNPGTEYKHTRHNAGFIVVNALSEYHKTSWKKSTKFNADIAEISLENEKVLLVKPHTFYNETGRSARAIIDFYKIEPTRDFLVLHDDLALPFGTVRVRQKGSDAGNNGIKSLNAHLGQEYWRIRIGIWNELRDRMNDADFVLSSFTKDETAALQTSIQAIISPLVTRFVRDALDHSSHAVDT